MLDQNIIFSWEIIVSFVAPSFRRWEGAERRLPLNAPRTMDDRDRRGHHRTSSASGDVAALSSSATGQMVLPPGLPSTSEDLHAWSIYRQNLNSDFTDSALGSSEKSPMPYGNFHLRETTMQSIINNPKYGPKSELGTNMFTYLKFGLPRVLPPNRNSENLNSSGYDSTDDDLRGGMQQQNNARTSRLRAARSEDFILDGHHGRGGGASNGAGRRGRLGNGHPNWTTGRQQRNSRLKSSMSEANLLHYDSGGGGGGLRRGYRSNGHLNTFVNQGLVDELEQDYEDEGDEEDEEEEDEMEARRSHSRGGGRMSKAHSQLSVVSRHSRATHLVDGGVSYRHEAPMLNDKYFPRDYLNNGGGLNGYHAGGMGNHAGGGDHVDGFKYPHLQLRNVGFATKAGERILEGITMEVRGGELMAVMATKRK